ncbi:unnamed protein product [Haemonchus placei]|uniref:Rab-GAP TBC domain-containing protein n=1 Tax=Haemonchus placei TaxID=6290 RepID=A0A0N4WXC6_HAEPC|nr:unnamed protein product [Haemonchus placei]
MLLVWTRGHKVDVLKGAPLSPGRNTLKSRNFGRSELLSQDLALKAITAIGRNPEAIMGLNHDPCRMPRIGKRQSRRMRFLAAIEFVHPNMKGELTWSKLNTDLLYTEKIGNLVKAGGIPHSMRPYLWPRFAGATKKRTVAGYSYDEVLRQSAQDKPSIGTPQIIGPLKVEIAMRFAHLLRLFPKQQQSAFDKVKSVSLRGDGRV